MPGCDARPRVVIRVIVVVPAVTVIPILVIMIGTTTSIIMTAGVTVMFMP